MTRSTRTARRAMTAGFAALIGASLLAGPAEAVNIGTEGCTPGYWKNHTENWQEYKPGDLVGSLDDRPYDGVYYDWIADDNPYGLAKYNSWTMLQALNGGGGSGVDGAAKILLRAATAAYLNAAHEGLGYPERRKNLAPQIEAAFASGDRAAMIALAAELDADNNLGCPLN